METIASGPQYPPARIAAARVHPRFREVHPDAAALPEIAEIERLIDAAFWASLRREENLSPQISFAFLPPEHAGALLRFEDPLALTPRALSRLAPAAERPGIHLGVWRHHGELRVWGATRAIPAFCFVLEVVAPGLLVLKYRRGDVTAKFVNVAVLEGGAVKVIDRASPAMPGIGASPALLEIAVRMRRHKRGGTLLVVPSTHQGWRESIRHPIAYSVAPSFARLAELMAEPEAARSLPRWQEAFLNTADSIAGLTAVDGATILTAGFEVLGFGAKIRRRDGSPAAESLTLVAPLEDFQPHVVPALQTGGTRHLSAAQFVHDQRDALALVASQDGRFTVFAWSEPDAMVRAHRVETLLL
ncbi:MAG: hypothetical protein KGN36_03690 [Acidobacteriota bacterium]|nr:hypothetical protein [Acidobacteriota bacterium]